MSAFFAFLKSIVDLLGKLLTTPWIIIPLVVGSLLYFGIIDTKLLDAVLAKAAQFKQLL